MAGIIYDVGVKLRVAGHAKLSVSDNGECSVWSQEAAQSTWDVLGAFITPSKDQVDSSEDTSKFSPFTASV